MSRILWPILAAGIVVLVLAGSLWTFVAADDRAAAEKQAGPVVEVYKTPYCGCCTQWVEYLADEGFAVEAHEVDQAALNTRKREAGLDAGLASCHTAHVDGYVVEGHVPAADIRRLLAERPDITGLAVPGMPIGSPGMEMGDRHDPYDVIAFTADGARGVFSSYHQD